MTSSIQPPPAYPIDIHVVICTYNNARILDAALNSLAAQKISSPLRWAVLVVNNNSSDDTAAVVESHIRSGLIPHLSVVLETRQGLTHARIRGVTETTAPWIAFVDDDNLLDPDWIDHAARFISSHPNAGMAGGKIALLWESPPPPIIEQFRDGFVFRDYGPEPIKLPAPGIRLPVGAGLLVRRDAIQSSGWISRHLLTDRIGSRLTSGGDTELGLRILKTNFEIWYAPTLNLRHFISSRRINFQYVCRLYRGFAESSTVLTAIHEPNPGFFWALKKLAASWAYFSRRTLAFIYHDLLRGRTQTKRRVQIHEAWGHLIGSWRYLFSSHHS